MTEAELKEIRALVNRLDSLPPCTREHPGAFDEGPCFGVMFDCEAAQSLAEKSPTMIPALLAHIDALATEVERLKDDTDMASNVISEHSHTIDSLRALVREAEGIIKDAYDSHYDARLAIDDRCAWCRRADAWQKKAKDII